MTEEDGARRDEARPCVVAAITLTIPDNEARTAYATLRRLGVECASLSRAELLLFADADPARVEAAVRRDEALFNGNVHRLRVVARERPEPGELWIGDDRPVYARLPEAGAALRLRSYRLGEATGAPAGEATLEAAARRLLCNPATQRRILAVPRAAERAP